MKNLAVFTMVLAICTVTLSAEIGKRSSDTDEYATVMKLLQNVIKKSRAYVHDFLDTSTVISKRKWLVSWWG
ncbi:hypothetical protein ACJMK2_002573 [Sinanodonta woodiana]|uniref:Uncharacterized protein n=1 Tax=Sinanodonta woodiana TaxID=1069815 RepID=A0ABD3XYW3_SINWO